jgi:TonB-linked SusC/RagA family outer membrane protein
MKKIQKILCLLLLVAFSLSAVAQQLSISGTVTDENGESVPGAGVVVKGTTTGVVTDADGKYSVQAPTDATLVFSFVGMGDVEEAIGGRTSIDAQLATSANELDEVVVVGYGAQKRAHLTGSIATVSPTEIADLASTGMADMLQGMVAGVSVNTGSDRPDGAPSRINIRNGNAAPGAATGSAELTPLYVIDGYTTDEAAFNNLDPSMIENISILKDASAAVYGARSAQGVVLVTTKRGQVGKPKISYGGQFGLTDEFYRSKVLDSYNYGQIWNAVRAADPFDSYNSTRDLFQADELAAMRGLNYDMLDKYWERALTQRHSITVSGGSENATYFGGVSYNTQEGNIGNISYDRWNYRAGMDAKINKWTKASLQVSGDYGTTKKAYNKVGGENVEKDYTSMLLKPRYIPEYVQDASGDMLPIAAYGVSNSAINETQNYHFSVLQNAGDYSINNPQNMTVNSSLEFDFGWLSFLEGLKFKATYSKSISTTHDNQYGSSYTLYLFPDADQARGGSGNHLYTATEGYPVNFDKKDVVAVDNGNFLNRKMSRADNYQLNFYATYARTFGLHSVNGLFTIEKSESEMEDLMGNRVGPFAFTNFQFNGADGDKDANFSRTESGSLSYVGRLNYAYDDKYLLEFLIRSDASTKFAPENYWGVFPSVSAGWVVSKESWFQDNVSFVDFLKVRGSYGMLGRDNIAAWFWMQSYGSEAIKGPIFGTDPNLSTGPHFQMKDIAFNRNAHWDKSYKSNVGLDMNFLANRLSATIDGYYNRNRESFMNIGGEQGFLGTAGTQAAPYNYGETNDYGMEFSLRWRDRIGKDFKYSVGVNTTWNDNKIIKYPFASLKDRGLDGVEPNQRSDRGLWGYECIGMFRSYQEIAEYFAENKLTTYDGLALENVHPGTLIYRDLRGSRKDDGTYYAKGDAADPNKNRVDNSDYVKISERTSNIYGFTMNLSAEYKGVSISTQLSANWGSYIMMPGSTIGISNPVASSVSPSYNAMQYTNLPSFWAGNMFVYQNVLDGKGEVVAEQNRDAKYPNLRFGTNSKPSTFWKVNAANIFLRNLTVAYSLPKAWVQKVGIEACRLNLTGQNLFDFYNPYPDKFMSRNSGYNTYPTLRRFTLGVNVSF